MINRVLFELLVRRHRLSTSLTLLVPSLIGVGVGVVYPQYRDLRKLAEAFKFANRFYGGEQLDLLSPAGSFGFPFQHPLSVTALIIATAIPAMAFPAGERGRGALDLVLATPLERRKLVGTVFSFQALIAPLAALSCMAGAVFGGSLAGVADQLPWGRYAVVAGVYAALGFALGGMALWVSVRSRERSSATFGYGAMMTLFMIIDTVARLWPKGTWLGYLTPLGYLRPAAVIARGDFGVAYRDGAMLLVMAAAFYVAAFRRQSRRRSV